jgi:hypothetical protein
MSFFAVVLTLFGFVFYSLYARLVAPLYDHRAVFYGLLGLGVVLVGSILWWFFIYIQSRGTEVKPYERFLEKLTHLSMAYISQLIFLTVLRDLLIVLSYIFPIHSPFIHSLESTYVILGVALLLLVAGMIQAFRAPAVKCVKLTDSRIKNLRIV